MRGIACRRCPHRDCDTHLVTDANTDHRRRRRHCRMFVYECSEMAGFGRKAHMRLRWIDVCFRAVDVQNLHKLSPVAAR